MKRRFITKNFRADSLALLRLCDQIIVDYTAQGFRLTLRQLYYQLVSRNVIPNTERSYKNLGKLVSDGRLAGLLDWDGIEDRARVAQLPADYANLDTLVSAALYSYRLPRWDSQPEYAELWVEKDALAGVLAPLGDEYHVPVMVNRGYSSQSAMYTAARRIRREAGGKLATILYLGDLDPSGEDMVRDVRDRLELFGAAVDVRKVAITPDQVAQYNPPPNPAKLTDSRAAGFIAIHGDESFEVDALPPAVLQQVIRDAMDQIVDVAAMDAVKRREEADKTRLTAAVASLRNGNGDAPCEDCGHSVQNSHDDAGCFEYNDEDGQCDCVTVHHERGDED